MSRVHGEDLIESIISEVWKECAKTGNAMTETLVAFVVKAVVLDPKNGFNVDRKLTKEDISKLQQLCLKKLTEERSPGIDTIKMQVYFDMNYTSRSELLGEIHRALGSKVSRVSQEITESRAKSWDELEALYQQIVIYTILCSELGSAADSHTVEEVTAVLQSILPKNDLRSFLFLLKKDKGEQLKEVTMIVTGIRLFNEASKNSWENFSIQQLMPAAFNEAHPSIHEGIKKELTIAENLVSKYTVILEKVSHSDVQLNLDEVSVTLLKQALYNVTQHKAFLKILLSDASLCSEHVESLQNELLSGINLLKQTVKPNTAVPTATVFPLFKDVFRLWAELQDEAKLLNFLNNITLNLQPFITSQANIFSATYLDSLLEAAEIKTDQQTMEEASNISDEQIDPGEVKMQEWLFPESHDLRGLSLQFNGFCAYLLVHRDGLLLPGNPRFGVLKHKEKLYAFSSREAGLKFASCPDEYIAEVAEKSKSFPELIQLLKLHQLLPCISPLSENPPEEYLEIPSSRCESGTQTDTHPVETNIVKSYEWNEWELRRKALKLVDLRTKETRSVQTQLSHMRRDNITQTWLPKDVACQSKRDGGSTMPTPQTYLTGLRGKTDAYVGKTDLTRPVSE